MRLSHLATAAALSAALAACAPLHVVVPAALSVATGMRFTTATTVLTDAARIACATQSIANSRGNAHLSYYAGLLCKW